jgi:predicted O-methyltransferase YrrM
MRLMKDLAYRTPAARYLAPRYHYNFRPAQLAYMVMTLDEIRDVPGSIVEVGCFAGATTIFLSEHLRDSGQRRYIAIDTFDGFTSSDIAHEISARGKSADKNAFSTGFRLNRREWVQRSLEIAGHAEVEVIKGDAGAVDYGRFRPIAFALIDVDLYQPVAKTLARIAPLMSAGGQIVVDDCRPGQVYDGALEAYEEWCDANGRKPEVVHAKLGILRF